MFAATTVSHDPTTSAPEVSVWDSATGKLKLGLPGFDGQPAFSPDCRTLAVTHQNGVVLIEVATGQARHEFRHHGQVEPAIAWRSDGRVLATASSEAPVYLWDVVGDKTGPSPAWKPENDDRRWSALCQPDAPAAFQVLRQLWTHPTKAVAFLRAHSWTTANARVASRVCEALEMIATPEAKRLLALWAEHERTTALAHEATSSLRRLMRT